MLATVTHAHSSRHSHGSCHDSSPGAVSRMELGSSTVSPRAVWPVPSPREKPQVRPTFQPAVTMASMRDMTSGLLLSNLAAPWTGVSTLVRSGCSDQASRELTPACMATCSGDDTGRPAPWCQQLSGSKRLRVGHQMHGALSTAPGLVHKIPGVAADVCLAVAALHQVALVHTHKVGDVGRCCIVLAVEGPTALPCEPAGCQRCR